jgi:hypothetical protein
MHKMPCRCASEWVCERENESMVQGMRPNLQQGEKTQEEAGKQGERMSLYTANNIHYVNYDFIYGSLS